MANSTTGNKIYIDSTGEITDARTKVAYIMFTPSASNDALILKETSSGSAVLKIQAATAKTTLQYDFSRKPLVFNNGIYVDTLTSGAVVTLVTTQGGD